ncbi:MAG TPA: hypothetical protein PKJ63_09610 [Cyclobacteriaceae bacterium]|nr:hypothetical protein [Cyclobacteriaceae bacterium]
MKRKDLIDTIENLGSVLIRHSANQDIYYNLPALHLPNSNTEVGPITASYFTMTKARDLTKTAA